MTGIHIRNFDAADQPDVISLFKAVNAALAPPEHADAFEGYIRRALREEIGQIAHYYRDGGFWVARKDGRLVGMFGLEPHADGLELRRMYVATRERRQGVGRQLLDHAERVARDLGAERLVLSTSALQTAALTLYRSAGFHLVREELADRQSHRTIGQGIRRYHFTKRLAPSTPGTGEEQT